MPGAKNGLVGYISRNPFAKAKKISSYDEQLVVAKTSKIRDSFKHLSEHKPLKLRKLTGILTSNSLISKPIKPSETQTPIPELRKLQVKNKLI